MAISEARMARFRSELEEEATRGGGARNFPTFGYFTPPHNKTIRVRILPGLDPEDPEKEFYVKVKQHYNVSPTKKIPVTCPTTKSPSAECPVCQRINALYKSGNKQDITEAKFIKARVRYCMGVIPQEGDQAGQILIWYAPKQVKDAIFGLIADPDYGDVTDLRTGRDLKITRTGEELNTVYQVLPVPTPSSMSDNEDELKALHAAQPPLYLLRNSADLDSIRKYMLGESETIIQGFATAATTPVEEDAEEASNLSVFTSAPSFPAPVAQRPVMAPVVVPPPVVAPPVSVAPSSPHIPSAPKKFDLSAIQAQVNKINTKK